MADISFDEFLWQPFISGDYKTTLERCARQLDTTRAADAIHIAGLALVKAGRVEDGIQWLEASLTLMRAKPEWFDNAATVLSEKKAYARAAEILSRGLQYYPDHFRLNYSRAVMFSFMNNNETALAILRRLQRLHPASKEIKLTLGYVLHMMGRFEEALETYDTITDVDLSHQEELDNNRNGVFLDMGRYQEALDVLRLNYADSKSKTTQYNMSLVELGLGQMPEAWQRHRARPGANFPANVKRPSTLEELANKDVFFFGEQGFGDCIQFVRYAPLLAKHCRNLFIGTPLPLVRLFNTLVTDRKLEITPAGSTLGRFDLAVPMLDAPALLNTSLDTIPAEVPYFKLPDNAPRWERRDARPHVGIVWHGSARKDDPRAYSIDKRRSLDYDVFSPIMEGNEHIVFVNLQVSENPPPPTGVQMVSVIDDSFDMLDTAMVIKQLDLVITIDSSLCHLTGALGKPVWMLNRYDSCWRWLWDGRETSPWYPTMRIFRQPEHTSWPQVVARVKKELVRLFP